MIADDFNQRIAINLSTAPQNGESLQACLVKLTETVLSQKRSLEEQRAMNKHQKAHNEKGEE